MMSSPSRTAVLALGGNAITQPGQVDTIERQFENVDRALDGVIELIRRGWRLVITHGNGPQVGNCLLRVEMSRGKAPLLPLHVLVADTEGGMGYMIEQCLLNRLKIERIERPVATIVTQMVVSRTDPAIENPSKFVGQFYDEDDARLFSQTRDWVMKKDANRGWRRVVPSPMPVRAVEAATIRSLVEAGVIVIAAGGGGVPVYEDESGMLRGIDAVIDKDLASAVLGREIGAERLAILTGTTHVSLHYGTSDQQDLTRVRVAQLRDYQKDGHFPAGSMGPKVAAAVKFIDEGGSEVAICSFTDAAAALEGTAGTLVIP